MDDEAQAIEDLKSDLPMVHRAVQSMINQAAERTDVEGLRDYFAGTAMQGLLQRSVYMGLVATESEVAVRAYAMADAMLKVRGER